MRYLGIDFGLRRVGLAVSDHGELAVAWKVLEVTGFKDAVLKVKHVVDEGKFERIVVGLPEGGIGKTVSGFINALRKAGLNVDSADESLSSKNAILHMIELKIPKKKRRVNDAYSAEIILQNYLDNK